MISRDGRDSACCSEGRFFVTNFSSSRCFSLQKQLNSDDLECIKLVMVVGTRRGY